MIRFYYEKELEELKLSTIRMSAAALKMIKRSVVAFADKNFSEARSTILDDKEIDSAEREIERRCLSLFLKQQPVAKDFREVTAILKLISDIERIGDQAADIAEITLSFEKEECVLKEDYGILEMADKASEMVHESMVAFINEDTESARKVIESDDIVDKMFEETLVTLAKVIKDRSEAAFQAIHLMMIAKYLERIADHATNIAEWVIYYSTGKKPNGEN